MIGFGKWAGERPGSWVRARRRQGSTAAGIGSSSTAPETGY